MYYVIDDYAVITKGNESDMLLKFQLMKDSLKRNDLDDSTLKVVYLSRHPGAHYVTDKINNITLWLKYNRQFIREDSEGILMFDCNEYFKFVNGDS